ncbi:MAG: hypothetical protein FJ100_17260 [Deltaproteobacteria bacterium]|nr:hypothetical protein [Deltaproteobacteria bacterium]
MLPLAAAACETSAPTPTLQPKLSVLHAEIFSKSCTNSACHGEGTGAGNLSLKDAATSYTQLVGKESGEIDDAGKPLNRVEPGKPDKSVLWIVLDRPFGKAKAGMPPGARLDPYKVDAVKAWIAAGAKND